MSAAQEVISIVRSNAPLLLPSLGFAALWVVVRYVFYVLARAYLSKSAKGVLKNVGVQEKVLEETFAIVGALAAFVLGYKALEHSDRGGCGISSTMGCFEGWPNATGPRDNSIALYHTVELGWYGHYLLKHALGIGMEDNLVMHLHHASTILLLLISFLLNLHRSGVLVLFILNISNPFLHLAKVLHHAEHSGDKVVFLLFAIAFFVSRIVLYPAVVLKATLLESWRVYPGFLDPSRHLGVYVAANALLGLLMAMQVQWFGGIVRLLTKAVRGSREEFKKEGKAHDYAKSKHE